MTDQQPERANRRLAVGAIAGGTLAAAALIGGIVWQTRDGGGASVTSASASADSAPQGDAPQVSVFIVGNDSASTDSTPESSVAAADEPTTTVVVESPVLSVPPEAPEQAPAFVVIEDGQVYLRGTAPDRATADALIEQASAFGNGAPIDELVIDPASPVGSNLPLFVPGAALFEEESANLAPSASGVLQLLAAAMMERSETRLLIRGHTDDQGSDAYNFALSQQRVAAVFAALASAGIDPARLILDPRGETEPIADNSTSAGRARNRRVELVLVDA